MPSKNGRHRLLAVCFTLPHMQGLHLTADLDACQCPPARLTDANLLLQELQAAVLASGLQHVAELAHTFDATPQGPGGVTATVLLAESHVCIHTWPERGQVTLDVYVCHFSGNQSQRAQHLLERLLHWFQPIQVSRHQLTRGDTGAAPALILAAGRGERMRPLTDSCPKPLLQVQGQPLLMWHVHALLAAGSNHLVVNTAWLAPKISDYSGRYRNIDGRYQLSNSSPFDLQLSDEQAAFGGALETAGGAARALPLLFPNPPNADRVFWVAAGDVFAPQFTFAPEAVQRFKASTALAHLWLVPNPAHNPKGDFGIDHAGRALNLPPDDTRTPRYTYSTIGLYRAELFSEPWCNIPWGNPAGVKAPLAPLLRRAMDAGRVTAELYHGPWTDVGTPERLTELNATKFEP